jgi:hypothetical protein
MHAGAIEQDFKRLRMAQEQNLLFGPEVPEDEGATVSNGGAEKQV